MVGDLPFWKISVWFEGKAASFHYLFKLVEVSFIQQIKDVRTGIRIVEVESKGSGGDSAHAMVDGSMCFMDPVCNPEMEILWEIHWDVVKPSKTVVSEVPRTLSSDGEFCRVVRAF